MYNYVHLNVVAQCVCISNRQMCTWMKWLCVLALLGMEYSNSYDEMFPYEGSYMY